MLVFCAGRGLLPIRGMCCFSSGKSFVSKNLRIAITLAITTCTRFSGD